MVDENGRPQSVSGYVTTVCIAGRPLESLVYARWSSVLHNQPQHQLSQSQISSKSVLPFDRRQDTQMAALKSGSEPYFHSFVWGYMQDQFCCIKHKFDSRAAGSGRVRCSDSPNGDAAGCSSEFAQVCPGVLGGVWRLFDAHCQTYLKNADPKLFSPIFEFEIQ